MKNYHLILTVTAIVSVFCLSLSARVNAYQQPALQLPGTIFESSQGAVATVNPLATQAAAEVLSSDGNAIDAAITAALTLGIVDSYNSGIGGGLFALIHWANGDVEAIDGREMAPGRATRDMYLRNGQVVGDLSRTGSLAIGIPGAVSVFDYLSKKGGKLPIGDIYRNTAKIASQGFTLSNEYSKRLQRNAKNIALFPAAASIFLDEQKQAWPAGHQLIQSDLAKTYLSLAKHGSDYFYKGDFATKTARWMSANDGIVSEEDFANYTIKVRKPIQSSFYNYTVFGFPPPSSGGVHVAQILSMFEQLNLDKKDADTRNHYLAESMKLAFADRAYWLGDSDFVKVPKGLIDQKYTQFLANKIKPEATLEVSAHSTPNIDDGFLEKHTTHIAVADKEGNWVAITTTLNTSFGSKVVIPETGVLMNNQMDDFSAQPGVPNVYGLVGSEANSIAPRKRPLSSMSPTIVLKDKKPIMTIGAAGGPMIITQVTQGIINHLVFGMSLIDSLAAPRIHQQWRPKLLFHDKLLPLEQQQSLSAKGHKLKVLRFEGSSNAITVFGGGFKAASEPRLVERNQP